MRAKAENSLLYRAFKYVHGDLPVKKGQKLAGTRIIPLVIEQEKMDAMQAAAGSEPILNVLPMQAKKFAVDVYKRQPVTGGSRRGRPGLPIHPRSRPPAAHSSV